MMLIAGALMIVPMLNFVGMIRNERASESDPEFVKSIVAELEIAKPAQVGTKRVLFTRGENNKQVSCLLPEAITTKEGGFAYEYKGSFISVICEGIGSEGEAIVARFAKDKTQPVRTMNGFKGAYEERDHPNASRRDRMYYLGSPKFSYSMMISWPRGDAGAKKDAEALASAVAYSIALN